MPSLPLHHFIRLLVSVLTLMAVQTAYADQPQQALQPKASVVRIIASSPKGDTSGSGFIVGKNGEIITNYHVVQGSRTIRVLVKENDKQARIYKGYILASDREQDLALLIIPVLPRHPLPPPLKIKAAQPQVLNEVLAIGFPSVLDTTDLIRVLALHEQNENLIRNDSILENLEPNITKGAITKITHTLITHDAKIDHGNSGGPLVDAATGEVVGINTAGAGNNVTFFFAIPPAGIRQFIARNTVEAGLKAAPDTPAPPGNHAQEPLSPELVDRAGGGDAEAQFLLGMAYWKGTNGMPLSHEDAVIWLTKAARQNHVEAILRLVDACQRGKGMAPSLQKAAYWLEKAAELDNPIAQTQLACLYIYGLGVPRSYQKALPLLRQAMEQKHPWAISTLALCYEKGWGVPQSDKEAAKLHEQAASTGSPDAQYSAGRYYYDKGTSKNFVKAAQWFLKSSEQGYSNSQNMLGNCYERGQGVPKSAAQTFYWYNQSAKNGNAEGMINVGKCYLYGRGTAQDEELAVACFSEAAELNEPHALFMLANCYEKGRGVPKSQKIAYKYFRAAAIRDEPFSQLKMGLIHVTGDGVEKSRQEAKYWFTKAAQNSNPGAAEDARQCLKRLSRE